MFEGIHFIRPWVFMLFIPWAVVAGLMWHRRQRAGHQHFIAPHLRRHLMRQPSGEGLGRWPVLSMVALVVVLTVAAAGPSWTQQAQPWKAQQASTLLVVNLNPSMLNKDIQPTRLERLQQKLGALLKRRAGQKHGLLVYTGSAHVVLPFTHDHEALMYFINALHPDIMPTEGHQPELALRAAEHEFEQMQAWGSILWVSDEPTEAFASLESSWPIHHYQLKAFSQQTSSPLAWSTGPIAMTPDNSDLEKIDEALATKWQNPADAQTLAWKDQGFWLTPLIACLILLWFIPGWVLSYEQ